jgi:high-affinity iron transporter
MKIADNKNKSHINFYAFLFLAIVFSFSFFLPSSNHVMALGNPSEPGLTKDELQSVFVNLERIRTQINLVNDSINGGDADGSFYHSYIPHSTTFPVIKKTINKIDPASSTNLESLLTDLPVTIKSQLPNNSSVSSSNIKSDLNRIQNLIGNINTLVVSQTNTSDQNLLYLQASLVLLKDALQSYNISNVANNANAIAENKFRKVDYENTLGLFNASKNLFNKSTIMEKNTLSEINTLYAQLEDAVKSKQSSQNISKMFYSIERAYSKGLSPYSNSEGNSSTTAQYLTNIRELMSKVGDSVDNGDYKQADKLATTAYLDNYEFLEAPIEKINATLMSGIEIDMRENLRNMIHANRSSEEISLFIDKSILQKLDIAEPLLKNELGNSVLPDTANIPKSLANIDALQQGFGVYTGERKEMGQANDSQKQGVRNNIDHIRLKLDEMLNFYKKGNSAESLTVARSAYLDSYENIEIPLRPINPDFTLDMEIKFAELRNLMQSQKPFADVEKKVIEIRKGLDESERLVSGTGIIAPTIAFSSSFSIIFREGLESALIIGAILTYLEASRNERFKKHVYYGIFIAVVGTVATWTVAEHIIQISGANRELIEAIAGLSAVGVLFWVSFWVLNKIETKRWIEFVKAKVWKATATGSVMVFVMLSFFTVYREGFETVLFYQAMLSYAKHMELYVILGLVLGLAVITGVAILIKKLGKRLPLRVLFGLTMGLGAYMSIAFLGNAIREFQDVGYLPTTPVFGLVPRLDINVASMTGIHPTLESMVGQIILLTVYAIGSMYVLIIQPRKKKKIEMARKSIGDMPDNNRK